MGPTQLTVHWVLGTLPARIKQVGYEGDHWPPASAEFSAYSISSMHSTAVSVHEKWYLWKCKWGKGGMKYSSICAVPQSSPTACVCSCYAMSFSSCVFLFSHLVISSPDCRQHRRYPKPLQILMCVMYHLWDWKQVYTFVWGVSWQDCSKLFSDEERERERESHKAIATVPFAYQNFTLSLKSSYPGHAHVITPLFPPHITLKEKTVESVTHANVTIP